MGLKTRMALTIFSLFGLVFALLMALAYWLMLQGLLTGILVVLVPVVIALLVVLLQWAIAPYIIRWIYDIRWTEPRAFDLKLAEFMERTCQERGIPMPRFGVIEDDNPNAFAFGWTRRKAHVVLTRGIMKYCGPEEREAVLAHELGHIHNNDFVVMTVVAAVPLLLYVIFRGALYSVRFARGGSRQGGSAALAILAVAAVSFVAYLVSNLIALLVGRFREYYADAFSADASRNPNALSRALLTIAYGLAREGKGERSEKEHARYESTLMIFNSKNARALAAMSADRLGRVDKERIKKVMAWDLWNPWAVILELGMTHPLTAKRVVALGRKAEEMGHLPYISFDLQKTESYWDDFLKDIFARWSWLLAFPAGYLGYVYGGLLLGVGFFFLLLGLTLSLYLRFYRYPKRFSESKVEDLLVDPKASPVRGRPATLKGKVIGRGQPGLFFSEDLKLDDGTGLLLLDYHQVSRLIDFFVGIFATKEKVGKEVQVEGWYRRQVIPYLEIYRMRYNGRRLKTYTAPLKLLVSVMVLLVGAFVTAIASGLL